MSFVCMLLRERTFIQYLENLPGNMAVSSKELTSSTSQDDLHSVESIQEGEGTDMSKVATYKGKTLASSEYNGKGLEEDEASRQRWTECCYFKASI